MDQHTAQGSTYPSLLTRTSTWLRKAGAAGLAAGAAISLSACSPAVEEPTGAGSVEAQTVATSTPTPTATATPDPIPTPEPTSTPTPSQTTASGEPQEELASAGTALAQLATIEIKGRAPKTGYDRDNFGSGWTDIDHNGCDTRIICTFSTSMMPTSWQTRA